MISSREFRKLTHFFYHPDLKSEALYMARKGPKKIFTHPEFEIFLNG